MNPQSGDVPLAKHLSKERKKPTNKQTERKEERTRGGMWTGIYKRKKERKHCILCKNCMHGICCGSVSCMDRTGGVGGWGGYCPLFPRRCQQYVEAWICSGLADGPSPVSGQPACQQHSLLPRTQCSACCAARGAPRLLLLLLRGVPPPPSPSPPILSRTLSSCQHAKQSERVYLRRDLEQAQMHSGCKV